MTDFNSLDSARETIAIFDRQIAQAEAETRRHVERLRAVGLSYESYQVRQAWDECGEKLKPLRAAREQLVQAMVTVESVKPPTVIIDRTVT